MWVSKIVRQKEREVGGLERKNTILAVGCAVKRHNMQKEFPGRVIHLATCRSMQAREDQDASCGLTVINHARYQIDILFKLSRVLYPIGKAARHQKLTIQTRFMKLNINSDKSFTRSLSFGSRIGRNIPHIYNHIPKISDHRTIFS